MTLQAGTCVLWHVSIILWADWNLEDRRERKTSILVYLFYSLLAARWCWEWLRVSKIKVSINSPSSVIPALNRALTPFPYLSPQAYESQVLPNSASSHVPLNHVWFPSPCHTSVRKARPSSQLGAPSVSCWDPGWWNSRGQGVSFPRWQRTSLPDTEETPVVSRQLWWGALSARC